MSDQVRVRTRLVEPNLVVAVTLGPEVVFHEDRRGKDRCKKGSSKLKGS
jgi:hypothetical protein